MSKSELKNIRIFPYAYKINGIENNIEVLFNKFKLDNLGDKTIYHDYTETSHLALIFDKKSDDNKFLYGRFLRLRKDAPSIINKKSKIEQEIDLDKDDLIKEESHFIWNVEESIIVAEYNYHANRTFTYPLTQYLRKILDNENCQIEYIENKDTYDFYKKKTSPTRKVEIGIAQANVKFLEDKLNMGIISTFLEKLNPTKSVYKVSVQRTRKKDSQINKDEAINFIDTLLQHKEFFKSIRVETDEATYDLIKNNMLFYKIKVLVTNRHVNKDNFFQQATKFYEKNIEDIKKYLK